MPSPVRDVPWTQLYIGLGFTTLATLILELSLTRIFSVVFYYHFAFLAISIALFGLGAGGVFSYVISAKPGNLYTKLGALALSAGGAVMAALLIILFFPLDLGYTLIAIVYLASALPFFFAGTVVSIAISEAIERVDRAYFWDLAGASAGCLLLIPFLHVFGGPNTVIAAAVLYLVSAAVWFHQAAVLGAGGARRRATAVLAALLLVILMIVNGKVRFIDVRHAKGQDIPAERFTAWNSFSRIGVAGSDAGWTVVIDGDATTGIASFDWDRGLTPDERFKLLHEGQGFPYILRPAAKTLVIGAGGGYDVARALAGGSHDVTAVEINPIIATDIMRNHFAAASHRIYFLHDVHVPPSEDGRSFVRRSPEKYQVIQATLVDTWASTAAGAFALSENNLYTADAFYDYFSHLTPDGLLSFTRWGFDPPRESLRLVTLAMDALGRLGESDFARHVIAVRANASSIHGWGALDTVLISREAFTASDAAAVRTAAADAHMDVVYAPGDPPSNAFGQLLEAPDPQTFLRDYPYNVAPVSDDQPFFFYTVQPRDLWEFVRHASTLSADYKVNRAVPLLFAVVGISLAATVLVLLLPRWLLGSRLPKQKGVVPFLWYFLFLGAGYILIQVALIQRFIILLGHPEYALTVIVFSMLVSSGLGSYSSKRLIGNDDNKLVRVLALVAVLIGALAAGAGPLVANAAAWPLPAKIALTAILIAPAAFLMGMPFPSGLRRLEQRHAPSIRWAWSLNSASSVLGSAGAIFLAIYFGLRATLLIGGALYLCAMIVILATDRRTASSRPA